MMTLVFLLDDVFQDQVLVGGSKLSDVLLKLLHGFLLLLELILLLVRALGLLLLFAIKQLGGNFVDPVGRGQYWQNVLLQGVKPARAGNHYRHELQQP